MSSINTSKVICFGEALLDRLGPLGGDPACDLPVQDCLGGAPANVACAMARLGVEVVFIGCLGEDLIGNNFRQLMKGRGVNISCLQTNKTLPSRMVLVRRDLNGERSFSGFGGNKGQGFSDQEIELNPLMSHWPSISKKASWLLVGTIPLASKVSSKTLLWTLQAAQEAHMQIAVDVNWRSIFWDENSLPDAGPNNDALKKIQQVLELASLIKLSKEEAVWFFQTSDPSEISRSLSQKPDVVVTDGSNPIRWLVGEYSGQLHVPKLDKIVDTTGAGDSFTAGLLSQLLTNVSSDLSYEGCEKIIAFAAACGAIVCLGAGAIDNQPNLKDVEKFLLSDWGGGIT